MPGNNLDTKLLRRIDPEKSTQLYSISGKGLFMLTGEIIIIIITSKMSTCGFLSLR